MTQDTPPPPSDQQAESEFSFGPTVTILFSDIRGFTDYTDAHGDADAYRMLQHHNDLVKEQIALYHGHIVKTLGDSYMVSFDAARNAITCAIAVQRQLAQYNGTQHGPKIEIGIGINMGEPIREGDDLFGTSVNLASRICAVAGAGRILVSEGVRYVATRLDSGDYVDRGYFDIKGFQEPQHLFEVDWSGLGAIRATQVAPPRRGGLPPEETETAAAPAPKRRKRGVLLGVAAAAVLVVVGAGALLLSRTGGFGAATPAPTVSKVLPVASVGVANKVGENAAAKSAAASASPQAQPAASPVGNQVAAERVLSADDFDNPNQRKFNDFRSGSGRSLGNGPNVEFTWDYHYEGGMLVASVKPGAWPASLNRANLGVTMQSTDRVQGDLAIEVTGRATRLPEQARYGFALDQGGEDVLSFTLSPGEGQFLGAFGRRVETRQQLVSGRSDAIRLGNQENRLRLEIKGNQLRFLINGQEVGLAQHPKPSAAAGNVELFAVQVGPGTPPDIEVRFDTYRVFALTP